jgi:hypothetical protein
MAEKGNVLKVILPKGEGERGRKRSPGKPKKR